MTPRAGVALAALAWLALAAAAWGAGPKSVRQVRVSVQLPELGTASSTDELLPARRVAAPARSGGRLGLDAVVRVAVSRDLGFAGPTAGGGLCVEYEPRRRGRLLARGCGAWVRADKAGSSGDGHGAIIAGELRYRPRRGPLFVVVGLLSSSVHTPEWEKAGRSAVFGIGVAREVVGAEHELSALVETPDDTENNVRAVALEWRARLTGAGPLDGHGFVVAARRVRFTAGSLEAGERQGVQVTWSLLVRLAR